MSATTTAQQSTVKTVERTLEQRFGNGKYFSIQKEVFQDVQRIFGITEDVAEKMAKSVATHLGIIFGRGQVTLKMGDKLNKDGQLRTIREICQLKNLYVSSEIALLRALQYCAQARSFHVEAVFTPSSEIKEWIDKL